MRRILTALLALLLLVPPAVAGPPQGQLHLIADGHYIGFDVPPLLVHDRVLVPFRWLAEFYGWEVAYRAEDETITATSGARTVAMRVGSTEVSLNGAPSTLDAAPRVLDGRTLVPLRFVAEALGATVAWDEPTRTVTVSGLTSPPPPVPVLQVAQVTAVKRAGRNYRQAEYATFVQSDPAGAAVISDLVTAWNEATPAVRPDLMRPVAPYGVGIYLETDAGNAIAKLAWACENTADGGRTCTDNQDGFLYLYSLGVTGEPTLVYAPALAEFARNYPIVD